MAGARSIEGWLHYTRPPVKTAPPEIPPEPPTTSVEDVAPVSEAQERGGFEKLVRQYFWFIFKNVFGWTLIIAAPILGIALPGPGGIPVFLIGFALVTFPGKRRLTTHVFRGRRLPIETPLFTGLITFFGVLVTAGLMWASWHYYDWIGQRIPLQEYGVGDVAKLIAVSALALPVTMAVTWVGLKILNYILLHWVPPIRRFLRRYLRKYGVRLLPTRRKRIGGGVEMVHDEIISLDETSQRQWQRRVKRLTPWLTRLAGVSLTVAVLYFVVEPVISEWTAVEARLGKIDILRATAGVALFAVGLLLFRTVAWRSVLAGLGQPLPPKGAARVWSLGHLARYIPGRSYRVLRMELARPYGVSGPQANVAQRLEGILALTAAVAVGGAAFWWTAWRRLPDWAPLWLALAVVGLAALLAVPTFFYKVAPSDITRPHGRRAGGTRLGGKRLTFLLSWEVLGVLWQSLAIWLLIGKPLSAEGAWMAVAGAWALGWAAGHLATWAPGGIGVREVVLVGCLAVLLPVSLRDEMRETFGAASTFLTTGFGDLIALNTSDLFQPSAWQDVWWAFLFFLALLLRLATTAAEFLYASIATAFDWNSVVAFVRGEPAAAVTSAHSGAATPSATARR